MKMQAFRTFKDAVSVCIVYLYRENNCFQIDFFDVQFRPLSGTTSAIAWKKKMGQFFKQRKTRAFVCLNKTTRNIL